MKSIKYGMAFLMFSVSLSTFAQGDSAYLKKLKKAGAAYRSVLIKDGWKPVISCKNNKQPEFFDCSSEGYCLALWKKDGQIYWLGTEGEVSRKVYDFGLADKKKVDVRDIAKNTDQCDRLRYYDKM